MPSFRDFTSKSRKIYKAAKAKGREEIENNNAAAGKYFREKGGVPGYNKQGVRGTFSNNGRTFTPDPDQN